MGIIGEKLDIDFVIYTGDNFYETGLTGIDDPSFEKSFYGIYTTKILKIPWYSGITYKYIICLYNFYLTSLVLKNLSEDCKNGFES